MDGIEPLGTFINIPSETHLVRCSTVCEEKKDCFLFLLITVCFLG